MTAMRCVREAPTPATSELVAKMIAGDEGAWREFHALYAAPIRRSIGFATRHRRDLASDEVAEIYANFCIRLLDNDKYKLRSFDPNRGCSLRTWLTMIARQAASDYLRARRRRIARDAELWSERTIPPPQSDAFDELWQRQRARIVARSLDRLSRRDREFYRSYFQEARLPDRIGQDMKISVLTVYTKKHKLVSRMTRLVDQQLEYRQAS
jgi:RNA polymerase sigma-70 factor, ECF subfamily